MRSLATLLPIVLLAASCASAPPPIPDDPNALRQLHLVEKGGPFAGGRVIFVTAGRLIVEVIPPGYPAMRRHVVMLDPAAQHELDVLARQLVEAPEPATAPVPLSVDASSVAIDLSLKSRRARSVFSPNTEHVWFAPIHDWLTEHAKLAELVPASYRGDYDGEWRPSGWLP